MNHTPAAPLHVIGARLPRWCLPADWPRTGGEMALAELRIDGGRITSVTPWSCAAGASADAWDVQGAPVLPGLVDAHTHLDKAFTLQRIGTVKPGLLNAIEAMMSDRQAWTAPDVHERASRALQWAYEAGVVRIRTHCDWWEPQAVPLAWGVLRELAQQWRGRLQLEQVSLIPLTLYAERDQARRLAREVAAGGPGARLGGFVHSTQWNHDALRHLLQAAEDVGLDVDLHCDEELNPTAAGLPSVAALVHEIGFSGRVVCGHVCSLAVQDDAVAFKTLDAVARAPITLVSLPATNLLLQDAVTGRTPRQRGITLVKEARARGIPVLLASDNVQDPFCAVGSFDPLDALATGVLAAQLPEAFDQWTEAVCRGGWLDGGSAPLPLQPGQAADFVVFPKARPQGWPSRSGVRTVVRDGRVVAAEAA